MNDNFYKQLIEKSQGGYAYHKIICDKDGLPCDYEFIEVNEAFGKLTGLDRSNIVGKKVTEILTDIGKDKFNWIQFYGDIAINGGIKELESFSESLNRWYRVTIYSPEKYYFITYFSDITKEMTQLFEMNRLVELFEEFLQINEQKIDYQKIVDDFSKITGAKYTIFNLFDEDGKTFSTMAISGKKGILNKVSSMLGFKLESKKWNYGKQYADKIKDSTITRFQSLGSLQGNFLPAPLIALIERTFNTGEYIVIKILRENIMIGTINLFMAKGEIFHKDTLAELYTKQLGMFITRKRAEDGLSREKILTDAIFQSAPGMIYLYDDQNRLVRWNKKHEDITGYASDELSKMNLMDWYNGNEKNMEVIKKSITMATKEGFGDCEADLRKKDGTLIPIHFTASSLQLDGKQYFAGIAIDITERKKKEEEILYLSYHDQLTGLYNRRFYEEELKRLDTERNLPMTIVMGDVNGLKLINDSFGHVMGDELLKKVAQVLKSGCRQDDIIARLGGDEFVIILPKTDVFEAEQIIQRTIDLTLNEKVGLIDISISFGYETKNNSDEEIEVILKNAEDHMYEIKLYESPSMRMKTIKVIINTFYENNKLEEEHAHRVSKLCKSLGEALGLPQYEIKELISVGLLHDIGKIAIDENILNKPSKLTDGEWYEIKRHSELGYRILNTVNDLSSMAIYVLHHHERWDGMGYPKGLKGEEIPFVSRIIAIANAYDAMTNKRIYRKTLTKAAAIKELQKNAGIQFDPDLTREFIEKVLL